MVDKLDLSPFIGDAAHNISRLLLADFCQSTVTFSIRFNDHSRADNSRSNANISDIVCEIGSEPIHLIEFKQRAAH